MNITIKVNELPTIGGFRVVALLPNGHEVGYANILINQPVADLCDLLVKDSYLYLWPKFMPRAFSIQRKRNFQNQGVGRQLLSSAIEHAKSKGCVQMKGWMHGDKKRLKRFYESFGFKITGINIALNLQNSEKKG